MIARLHRVQKFLLPLLFVFVGIRRRIGGTGGSRSAGFLAIVSLFALPRRAPTVLLLVARRASTVPRPRTRRVSVALGKRNLNAHLHGAHERVVEVLHTGRSHLGSLEANKSHSTFNTVFRFKDEAVRDFYVTLVGKVGLQCCLGYIGSKVLHTDSRAVGHADCGELGKKDVLNSICSRWFNKSS